MSLQTEQKAKKSLGQNFLTDRSVIERIVAALELKANDSVVEIGPGRGALTDLIAGGCSNLLLVEKDDDLAAGLQRKFKDQSTVNIVNQDFLEIDLQSMEIRQGTKLVGNLPYNVGTAIVRKVASSRHLIERAVFMLQKEVVDRIVAVPGDSARGYLSVITQLSFECKRLFDVSPGAFVPRPKVTSSVVMLRPIPNSIAPELEPAIQTIISEGFKHPRKTIINNLLGITGDRSAVEQALLAAGIPSNCRPSRIENAQWIALSIALSKFVG
jgi:16S rRNA (adenine1518-N6/adenine1519-N6)-dimethyltransferase